MAKGKGATAPAAETPAESGEGSTRVGALHQAHADFIKAQTGVDVTPEQVFAVYSTRVKFRKSEGYQTDVRAAKAAEKEAKAAAKAKAAEEREKARAEKAAAKEAADSEKAAKKAAAPAKGKGKQTSQEAIAEASTAQPAKAKKTGSAKGKAKADKPF